MTPTMSPLRRVGVERELDAWRRDGDWDSANALLRALRPSLAELGAALGMLYTEDQASRAVKAALAVVNRRKAPTRWRRRDPGVDASSWQTAPIDTFAAVAVHALFDLASVPDVTGPESSLDVIDRAVLRLQLADIIDDEPLAEFLGVDLDELDRRCDLAVRAPARGRARQLVGAGATGGLFTIGGPIGAALAAPAAAAGIAAVAVAVAVVAGGLAVTRTSADGVSPVEAPSDAGDPGGSQADTVPEPEHEGIEGPAPGVEIPGVNVPTVPVDTIRSEDVLPEGVDPRDLVPLEVPDLPQPTDLPVDPGQVDPGDVLPTDVLPVDPTDLPTDLPVGPPVDPGVDPTDLLSDLPVEDVVPGS